MIGSDIGDINSPTHAGQSSEREWIPSCLKSLQISLETDENDDTSSGDFVSDLISFTIQLRSDWIRQQVHLESLGKRSRIAERRIKRCT